MLAEDDDDLGLPEAKRANLSTGKEEEVDEVTAALMGKGNGKKAASSGTLGGVGGGGDNDEGVVGLLKNQFAAMRKEMSSLLVTNKEELAKEIVGQVTAQVAPIGAKVDALTTRQEEQAEQIKSIQAQLQGRASSDMGSAGSTRAASDSGYGFSRRFGAFSPGYIQVSGFSKKDPRVIENRDQSKITVEKARNMIVSLYAVSASRGEVFDKERTERDLTSNKFGVSRFRVYFKSGTLKDTVWEVRAEWTDAFCQKSVGLMCPNAFGPYQDQHLGWLVEPAPEDRKRISETRKATAQFHNRKTVRTANVAFESGGSERAWMYGQASAGSDRICIGDWSAKEGWKLSPAQLQLVDANLKASEWEGALNATR